jgi:hypothetical protein
MDHATHDEVLYYVIANLTFLHRCPAPSPFHRQRRRLLIFSFSPPDRVTKSHVLYASGNFRGKILARDVAIPRYKYVMPPTYSQEKWRQLAFAAIFDASFTNCLF